MIAFNAVKHHAGYVRELIRGGALDLTRVGNGSDCLMDFYCGELPVSSVLSQAERLLKDSDVAERSLYIEWLRPTGWRTLSFSDGSEWCFTAGKDPTDFVHLFPARGSPLTVRVRPNTLKTAVALLTVFPGQPANARYLDSARRRLGLEPVSKHSNISAVIRLVDLLRSGL